MKSDATPLSRFQASLEDLDVEGFLVNHLPSVHWLTGFSGSAGLAVVTPSEALFITDSRYTLQAAEEVRDLDVRTFRSPVELPEFLFEQVKALGKKRWGIDEAAVTVGTHARWKEQLGDGELVPLADPSLTLRQVKSDEEIRRIAAACEVSDACLEMLRDRIRPGETEIELHVAIEGFMRRHGSVVSFEPIVVSGERSARPHGVASDKPLESGDFLTIDLGARLDGYCSDITRTFVVGKARERQREIYHQVLEAEQAGIRALVPGARGQDVDALARRILDEKDLAQYFGHGLGHGLGSEVHDPGRLNATTDQAIEKNQVWTVEPGVYIEGLGGVRIEDDVVVTDAEPRVLNRFPRELLELG